MFCLFNYEKEKKVVVWSIECSQTVTVAFDTVFLYFMLS